MLYSLSHRWRKARLNPADPVLGYCWRPPGHHGPCVTVRQQVRAEGVSNSRRHPTCHRSLHGYLVPAYYEKLLQLTVGPVLVTAGQNPRLPRVTLGVVQVSAKPRFIPVLRRAGATLSQGGSKLRAAPGMAALEKSNANRADTAPACATHAGSSPASFCWWADVLF